MPALGFLAGHVERAIEGSAGDRDAELPIEHEERFADSVHDGLFQGATLGGAGHRIFLHNRPMYATVRPLGGYKERLTRVLHQLELPVVDANAALHGGHEFARAHRLH